MKMYQVGGCVRDEIMGLPSKDIDFTVVLDENDVDTTISGAPFKIMVDNLERMGFKIFLLTPEYLTVRAQFPKVGLTHNADIIFTPTGGMQRQSGLTADFVLARKESDYTDGRRPDTVEPGTLEDDLARRDFTMNAIAKDGEGNFIDPYNGREDISRRLIRAVGDPHERLAEDALRAVRALRFSVTKNMQIDWKLTQAMNRVSVHDAIVDKISDERIKDELSKMFRFDTVASLQALQAFPSLTRAMFTGTVSLDSTMKTKGRGK